MQIKFFASLPPIMSAINIDGMDGNARIKLDIPGSESAAISELCKLQGKLLRITIEEEQIPQAPPLEI